MKTCIQVKDLSKRYRLGLKENQAKTLSGQIANIIKAPWKNLKMLRDLNWFDQEDDSIFWALKDINFEVKEGEVLGIIGKNGAGKSTLLKILSQITEPTSGKIEIRGRVASLLEVGTGFHPELSGRDNIYMNGTILGMTKGEIDSKLDEIIDFSGVEKFVDTPVKFYSSGMKVRLGFSVAAHLEPEILIIDEVLAVGDYEFQKKCLGKMEDVAGQGRTVLFVSHNLSAVNSLCNRVLVLSNGNKMFEGATEEGISRYLGNQTDNLKSNSWENNSNPKQGEFYLNRSCIQLKGAQPNLELILSLSFNSSEKYDPAFIAIDLKSFDGNPILQFIPSYIGFIKPQLGIQDFKISCDLPPIMPGTYSISVWAGSHFSETYRHYIDIITFEVIESPVLNRVYPFSKNHGYIYPSSIILTS